MRAGIRIIDKIRGTQILSKYSILLRDAGNGKEFENPDKAGLAELLTAVKKNNKFYNNLLSAFTDKDIYQDAVQALKALPIMDKSKVNNNISSIFMPVPGRKVHRKKTGGSTGNPFYYYVDSEHLSWFWAYIYFFWNKYSGYNPGDPFITIAGNSLRTDKKAYLEKVYHKLQNNYFIKGDIIGSDIRVNERKVSKAVLLYGYPSSIVNLLRVKPDFVKIAKNVKAIFTTSEQLLPRSRTIIEKAFNLPVFDMYGANDGGILTCECHEHNGYHINTQNCYVETFENELGMSELLLTNLNCYGFPLIRYRVGDLGKIQSGNCSCGLSSPKIIELKGRTRDVLKLRDGTTIHGSLFNKVFYNHTEIDAYKILQKKDHSITLFIHIENSNQFPLLAEKLIKEISAMLPGVDLHVELMQEMNPTNDKFKLIESYAV
jgi:phenylacetate-CoA ligase